MHTMSSARRDKLRLLQEREACKARMGRLQTMLQQKLIHKYGSKRNPTSRLNAEIEDEVKAFASRNTHQPTDEQFLELENTVRELRAKYSKNGSVLSKEDDRGSTSSTRGGRKNDSRESSKKGEADGGDDTACPGNYAEDGLPPSIARAWRTFDVAKQIEYETKEEEKAEKARLQKIRFREELEIHRAEQARKKAVEEEERRNHMEEQEIRLAAFRMEQEVIKRRTADRHAEEKALREEQVKRLQAEKEVERQAKLEREMQDIEQCKRQLQGEVNEAERRRMAEKERLALIQEENAKQKQIWAEKQRKADEADAELLKEHRKRIDAEERKRAEVLKGRMKRYEDIGKFWNERGAGKIQADNDEREEKQTVRAARLKKEADLEREEQEREKRRLASLVMASENRKAIQKKNAANEKKQKEEMEFAQRFISDSEAFKREEREKIAEKKVAMARYRQDLERQVEETKARRQYEDMNETEFRLNSDLVKKLEADKKLVAQVRQRMESAH